MRAQIIIGTTVYGATSTATVSLAYHQLSTQLMQMMPADMLPARLFMNADVVKARSMMVRYFLQKTSGTHLLFWDEDVAPPNLDVVPKMLALNAPIVALPYPRKTINWEKIADEVRDEHEQATQGRQTAQDLKNLGTGWPVGFTPGASLENGAVDVDLVPMGFTLISRECLQTMTTKYAPELTFLDPVEHKPTVALFQLMIRDRILWSEDFSFSMRAKESGFQPKLYAVEPGDHIGAYRYTGHWGGLIAPQSV